MAVSSRACCTSGSSTARAPSSNASGRCRRKPSAIGVPKALPSERLSPTAARLRVLSLAMAEPPARVSDVHRIAASMPHVKRLEGPKGNSIYQVGGKSFVFFRTPQPDATDPETGERYADVIMLWWGRKVTSSPSPRIPSRRFSPQPTSTDILQSWCGRADWKKSAAQNWPSLFRRRGCPGRPRGGPRRGSPASLDPRAVRSAPEGVELAATMFRHKFNGQR